MTESEYHRLCAQCWDALGITEYTGKHIAEHICELKTLATEAEQLRKERDELAKFIMGEGKRSECYPLAKRIIENGNA
jgi:hypothetical protein